MSNCVLVEPHKNGYRRVGKQYPHRIACEEAHGPPPPGKDMALHRCPHKNCVNGQHLYWGDAHDNAMDAIVDSVLFPGCRLKG